MKIKRESEVAQSCPPLRDRMDCSLPGSSVHGISRQEYWSVLPLPSLIISLGDNIFKYNLQWARLQQYMNQELPYVQGGFRKGKGTRDQIASICWIIEKMFYSQKLVQYLVCTLRCSLDVQWIKGVRLGVEEEESVGLQKKPSKICVQKFQVRLVPAL